MPDKEVPVPRVAAPRSMTTEQSRPHVEPSNSSWLHPGRRLGEELGEWLTDPDFLRARDGNQSELLVPTHSGPGTDMRGSGRSHSFLESAMNDMNTFPTIVPDTHRELMQTAIPQAARDSLDGLGEDVHDPFNLGAGDYNIDEYSMIMDELPEGYDTPEQFLEAFLLSPNGMANDQSFDPFGGGDISPAGDFDTYNTFRLNESGSNDAFDPSGGGPGVGDWYHIDIPGNDGDVMIVDAQNGEQRDSATVQTMTDGGEAEKIPWPLDPLGLLPHVDPTVDHPVSGRRQFGMEQLEEGGYRFYTRGFDRQTNAAMDPQPSNNAQHADWSSLMEAMATEHGGRAERTDENGDPMWGWAQQVPLDAMMSSMVRDPVHNDHLRPDVVEE